MAGVAGLTAMTALERLRRLLAVIPWVVEANAPLIDDVVARFDYDRDELLEDLEKILFFVGVHPFTPDCLIEVDLTEDRVRIGYAEWFRRPMRLSLAEMSALHAAGTAVAQLVGGAVSHDADLGPLGRALTKLSGLTKGTEGTIEIRLGTWGDYLTTIREALQTHEALRIEYHSFHRDSVGIRIVEPHHCYADKGHWYLTAYCRSAEARRSFRLDRIRRCEPTGETFAAPDDVSEGLEGIPVDGRLPEVVLELDPKARWVVDEYPYTGIEEANGTRLRVQLPVASLSWLERLLVRLGPDATVVEASDGLGIELRRAVARRILERYRD